eukprot:124922-Rhodomonas_salina.1
MYCPVSIAYQLIHALSALDFEVRVCTLYRGAVEAGSVAPYALSSTDIGSDATVLRIPYALSGTELDYAATALRLCSAMSSTEIGYAAMSY